MHPTAQDGRDAGGFRKEGCDVAEEWLILAFISGANGNLDHSSFGLVEAAADGPAKIDRIRGRRPDPGFVMAIGRTQLENVQ